MPQFYSISLLRSLFRDVLSQMQHGDEESVSSRYSSAEQVDFTGDGQWDNVSMSSKSSAKSNNMASFRSICRKLNAPPEMIEVVGRRFLGLRERNKHEMSPSLESLDMQRILDFLADVFIRCINHADLVLLALDDVQWMDEMSWKVIEIIFSRTKNVLILCGSRPTSSNQLTVDPRFCSDLLGPYRKDGRYSELSLVPFTEIEVKQMIADTLEFETNEIDDSFSRSLFNTSGGMPHYLSYALDSIKRSNYTVRLETGMIGLNISAEEDNKVIYLRIESCCIFSFASRSNPFLHFIVPIVVRYSVL